MSAARPFTAALSLLVTTSVLSGCATTNLFQWKKDDVPKAGPKNPVVEILPLWQPGEGMWTGRTIRGFIGQVFFFTPQGPAPAEVDGEVMVYVFDDVGTPEEQAKPIHQFRFPAETWDAHKHKSKLGLAYSLFIPYTRPGHQEALCSLRMMFTPKNALPVHSQMVSVSLPGSKRNKSGHLSDDDGDSQSHPAYDGEPATPDGPLADSVINQASSHVEAAHHEQLPRRRRTAAVRLDDAERERIIRETRARMAAEDGVYPAGYDTEDVPARRATAPRKRHHPLSEPVEADDYDDGAEMVRTTAFGGGARRQHVLSDLDDMTDDESIGPQLTVRPAAPRQPPRVKSRQRQPLQLDSAGSAERNRPRRESFTMSFNIDADQRRSADAP
ncbi:MAG: hypothetical protein ACT4QC_06865 [Planctomycetaceae bacterium]